MTEIELIKRIKVILRSLGKVGLDEIPFCWHMMRWQLNEFSEMADDRKVIEQKLTEQFTKDMEITPGYFSVQRIDTTVYLVAGNFSAYMVSSISNRQADCFSYDVDVVYHDGKAKRVMIHGNRKERIVHIAKSDEDHFYMLHESEIRYIDCERNNCIWHCINYDARERITLKSIIETLSDSFCRISKSCIVNLNYIREMKHYELVMDNGESLFISRRFYADVKRKITERDLDL